jgi:hypothetical protein
MQRRKETNQGSEKTSPEIRFCTPTPGHLHEGQTKALVRTAVWKLLKTGRARFDLGAEKRESRRSTAPIIAGERN